MLLQCRTCKSRAGGAVAQLFCDQLEFANVVIMNKMDLTYRSTANTSQHLLTVAQNDLFRVYMDRKCDCGQGALKYS